MEEPAAAEKPAAAEQSAEVAEPAVEEPEVSGPEGVEEPVAEKAEAGEPEAPAASTAEPEIAEEPVAETATETDAPAEPSELEPAAADGAQPPQGPPAADDESRTGGAGGNDTAEGEAEATADPEPADGAGAGGNDTAEGEAEAAPKTPTTPATPKPALTLTQLKTRAPGLATAYRTAATTLKTHNLTGTRAKVYLVLDRSASMRPYYKDGSAQALAEQTLALAAHLDPEATVPVVFFSTELDGTGEITLTDHENKIDDLHASFGRMGRTSYHAAVEAVLARHDKETPGTPALVVFQTDGAPDAKTPATQSLTDAAKTHPSVFFSFVAFGDPENKAFDYLRKLKTPNTSHFLAGETPRELTDKQLYDGVLANWRP
ncbi:VWA domain-containing protein [Streptomyces olindensis]